MFRGLGARLAGGVPDDRRGEMVMKLPNKLPIKPIGWTKQLSVHLNFGSKGGAAVYNIKDASGNKMPIIYQYDTRDGGLTGFGLPGVEETFETWAELCAAWPDWLKKQDA